MQPSAMVRSSGVGRACGVALPRLDTWRARRPASAREIGRRALRGPKLLESLRQANRAAIALDWDCLGELQKVIAITLGEVLVYDDLQPAIARYTVVPGIALQILLGHSSIWGACHEAPSQRALISPSDATRSHGPTS